MVDSRQNPSESPSSYLAIVFDLQNSRSLYSSTVVEILE
jgi:hypothetical protein